MQLIYSVHAVCSVHYSGMVQYIDVYDLVQGIANFTANKAPEKTQWDLFSYLLVMQCILSLLCASTSYNPRLYKKSGKNDSMVRKSS